MPEITWLPAVNKSGTLTSMVFARLENSKLAEAWNKRDRMGLTNRMGLTKQIRVIARERVVYRLLIYRGARRCANMAATI